MKLEELFDITLLADHLVRGTVSKMQHPFDKDLSVYNYTHIAQHENVWDEVTEQTRGLIVRDSTREVLARPFRKFFNLNTSFRPETQEENLAGIPVVLEKLDGSLGILYWDNEVPAIATRGSFWSDQAQWATTWLRDQPWPVMTWPPGYTPLFEIIYKENRIVVDYGDYEGCVLLGLVSIDNGAELPYSEVVELAKRNGLRYAKAYPFESLENLKAFAESNTEGFVLQYSPKQTLYPLRVKVKTEEYCRLHKIITGMNPKGIWEHLKGGFPPDAIWASTTPQFSEWAIGWIHQFQDRYKELETNAFTTFGRIYACVSEERVRSERKEGKGVDARALRKLYALAIQKELARSHSILFAILSGSGYRDQIWKELEPKIMGKEVYLRDGDQFNGI